MNNALAWVLTWLAGLVLGAVFFGGLWWTVHKGAASTCPARWFLGSMLLRTGMVLTGFYFVGAEHWQRLLVCLLGFVMARYCVIWLTRQLRHYYPIRPEVHHES